MEGVLAAGLANVAKGDWYGAADCLQVAKTMATDAAQKKAVEDLSTKVVAAAEKAMTDAAAGEKAGKLVPAYKTYAKVYMALGDTPVGKQAQARLQAAEKDKPEAVKEARASILVDQALEMIQAAKTNKTDETAALAAMKPAEQAPVIKLLEQIVKEFPKTPSAEKAQKLLDKVKAAKPA